MHPDEITLSTAQAIRLIDRQMPALAGRPVRPLAATGTDNLIFRVGAAHLMRCPRRPSAVALLERERTWLPRFGDLQLEKPEPVATGAPGEGYPWPWAVYRWIAGRPAAAPAPSGAALALAGFVTALRTKPGMAGPIAGAANHHRGAPLDALDATLRKAIAGVSDLYPEPLLRRAWERALAAPAWQGPPTWLHGDLQPGNLILRDGRLAAVIDFGLLARGDPAVDLIAAWCVFDADARAMFLDALGATGADIARGRGWALYTALVALAYYRRTNLAIARQSRRTLAAVLEDPAP